MKITIETNFTGHLREKGLVITVKNRKGSCTKDICFTSDLDIAQRILLQNFNTPTDSVFSIDQKEESRLKINHAAEDLHLQEPMNMSIEYGILCVQIVN
ncbi:hypothetical protein NQ318_009179 [Aromia moschata]|uniref:Uncharacterized protein n=1 Tax=Aromia moschata TaxID=1265417 RepID=A0AAV8XWP9_9CUCU|nr:hypothetical protein NQ318_009179 [Aromia moschata]